MIALCLTNFLAGCVCGGCWASLLWFQLLRQREQDFQALTAATENRVRCLLSELDADLIAAAARDFKRRGQPSRN
jgi:hypothetical protein